MNDISTLSALAAKHGTDKGLDHCEGNPLSPKGYTQYYERYFIGLIMLPASAFLEIGVWRGASLRMWEEYLPYANVYGVDVKPECKKHETERTKIFIGSQSDKTFLKNCLSQIKQPLRVVVDDGSHVPQDQIASFEVFFPALASRGWYVIEDLRTHYTSSVRNDRALSFFDKIMQSLHGVGKNPYPIDEIHLHKGIVFIRKGE